MRNVKIIFSHKGKSAFSHAFCWNYLSTSHSPVASLNQNCLRNCSGIWNWPRLRISRFVSKVKEGRHIFHISFHIDTASFYNLSANLHILSASDLSFWILVAEESNVGATSTDRTRRPLCALQQIAGLDECGTVLSDVSTACLYAKLFAEGRKRWRRIYRPCVEKGHVDLVWLVGLRQIFVSERYKNHTVTLTKIGSKVQRMDTDTRGKFSYLRRYQLYWGFWLQGLL
jgi:hypothetical protein